MLRSDENRAKVRIEFKQLLPRLRQTLSCPIKPLEVYRAAFPSQRHLDWLVIPSNPERKDLSAYNLDNVISKSTLVFFSMEDPEVVMKPTLVDQPDNPTEFWMEFPHPVAAAGAGAPLLLSDKMRKNPELVDWINAMKSVDAIIDGTIQRVVRLVAMCGNDIVVGLPELVQAIPHAFRGIAAPRGALVAKRARRKVLQVMSEDDIAKMTELVAQAVMLPEGERLTAWLTSHVANEGG